MEEYSRDYKGRLAIFSSALVFGVVFFCAVFEIHDPDFFWHLSTGKLTFEQGAFLLKDPFTYTVNGTPLVLQDWLSQVVFYGTYKFLGGFTGIIVGKALLAASSFTLGYLVVLRRRANSIPAIALFLIGMISVRHGFVERPYMFSLLFLALTYFLLYRAKNEGKTGLLFLLPPLFALWGNIHAGFIFGFALIFAFLAGALFDRFFLKKESFIFGNKRVFFVLFLTCLAPLWSPLGVNVYIFPFTMVEIYKVGALTNSEFLFPYLREFPIFWTIVVISVVVMAARVRKVDVTDFFVLFGFTLLVFLARRNVVQYMVIALPIVLIYSKSMLGDLTKRWQGAASIVAYQKVWGLIFILMAGGYLWSNSQARSDLVFGGGINENVHPVKAADFIEKNNIAGHMYNDPYWGGYLMWRFYPQRKIFVDSRGHVSLPILLELQGGSADKRTSWPGIVRKYGIDYTIMRYSEAIYPGSQGGERTLPAKDWALVYWDDTAMVYLKRIGKFQSLISQLEYRYVKPDLSLEYLQKLASRNRGTILLLKGELTRKIKADPSCGRANFLMGAAHLLLGDVEEARRSLLKTVALDRSKVGAAKEVLARMLNNRIRE